MLLKNETSPEIHFIDLREADPFTMASYLEQKLTNSLRTIYFKCVDCGLGSDILEFLLFLFLETLQLSDIWARKVHRSKTKIDECRNHWATQHLNEPENNTPTK